MLSLLDDKWADYSLDFIRRMARRRRSPGSSTTARAARTSTTTRTSASSGRSPAKHPYKDTIVELDDIVGRLVAELEATGQLDDTLIFISSDNGPEMETWPDAAYTPFRCAKGSTWEGGQRVPGIVVVAGHDRRRPRERRPVLADGPLPHDAARSPAPTDSVPTTATSTASTRRRSCSRPTASRTASISTTGSANVFSALRVGEYKFMLASTSDDDRDVLNLGGFTGVTQQYTLRPAVQPLPRPEGDPELHDPQARVHRQLHRAASATTSCTFGKYPPKQPIASMT